MWSRALVALQAATGSPELAGLDPARADDVEAAAKRAAAGLAHAREAEQRARALRDGYLARAGRLDRRLAEVRAAEQAAASLAAATEPVIYLAGLAKGMEGHRRVALTTYVLRHWFEQVVAAANVRLAVMSAGRYELRRSDEGDSRRQRAGLTLAVIDRHTGEERSPKSLSGGETFYTSLALALGLADVVKAEAGGVDTETLFIDEGFGSLDAETLDQVLGVIDELRDHGRAIGIVSHVADLKDRIAERLEVRRLPDGASSLESRGMSGGGARERAHGDRDRRQSRHRRGDRAGARAPGLRGGVRVLAGSRRARSRASRRPTATTGQAERTRSSPRSRPLAAARSPLRPTWPTPRRPGSCSTWQNSALARSTSW